MKIMPQHAGYLDAGAAYMADRRSDLWTKNEALLTLVDWCNRAKDQDHGYFIASGGFALFKFKFDDHESLELYQQVVDLWESDENEPEDTSGFTWERGL